MPWVTVYSLRQRKNRSKNLLNQRSKNSLSERLKQQHSHEHWDWVNSSVLDRGAVMKEKCVVTACKEFTKPKPVGGIKVNESYDWTSLTWSSRSGCVRLRGSRSQVHLTLPCRHHRKWQVVHGYAQAVELRNGHVNHQISHQRWRNGCGVCRNRSRPGEARRSRSVHGEETDCCPVTFCIRGDTSKPREIHTGHQASQIRVTFSTMLRACPWHNFSEKASKH